jgi:Flp pilus assembly protein TadG
MRRFYQLGEDRVGTATVEFAIVLPIMLVLAFVVLETTLAIMSNMFLTNAAEAMSDIVAQEGSPGWSVSNVCTAGQLSMTPLSGTPLKVAIASVTNNGGSPTLDWQDTSCGNASAIANVISLAAPLVPKNSDSVIVVQATYTYTPPMQFLFASVINMQQNSIQRSRPQGWISSTVPAP